MEKLFEKPRSFFSSNYPDSFVSPRSMHPSLFYVLPHFINLGARFYLRGAVTLCVTKTLNHCLNLQLSPNARTNRVTEVRNQNSIEMIQNSNSCDQGPDCSVQEFQHLSTYCQVHVSSYSHVPSCPRHKPRQTSLTHYLFFHKIILTEQIKSYARLLISVSFMRRRNTRIGEEDGYIRRKYEQ
jgi:hypothetical protein